MLQEYNFGSGIDQRTRVEFLDPARSWAALENVRFPKTGGADKRYGFGYTSGARIDATSRSTGARMYADRLVASVLDGTTVDTYSQQAAVNVNRGKVPEAVFRLIDMPSLSKDGTIEDVEYCNGYFAVTSTLQSNGSSWTVVTIVDANTGAIVRGPDSLGTFTNPLVASYSTYFLVLKCDAGSTTISVMYLDTTSTTTINAGWAAAGGNVTTAWAVPGRVSVCSLTDRVAIGFNLGTGTNRVAVKTWNIAGQVESTTVNSASVTPTFVDVAGSSADTLWVAWNQTTSTRVIGLTPTAIGTPLATAATIMTTSASSVFGYVVAGSTIGKGRLIVSDVNTSLVCSQMRGFQTSAGAAATDGSQKLVPGVQPLGRPFQRSGRYYVLATAGIAALSTTSQSVACVCDFTDDNAWIRPVCNIEPGLAVASTYYQGKCVAGSVSTKRYLTQNIRRSQVANAAALVELDFASTNRWQAVAHGNSTYLSGGVLGYVDGKAFNESCFMHAPPTPTATTSGTGITLTTGRRYVVVYEAIDADGNWTISSVSNPSASTGAVANKTITIVSQPCAMTYRLDSNGLALATVRAVLYATGDTGGTAPYYRHSVLDNDTSSNVLSFTDTTTDASLTANAKLYLQPGVVGSALDRRAPPGPQHLVSYNGMLVAACGSNVWFSGQPLIGEAAWFNPAFQVPIDGDGDITGLWSVDGTLFVAKRRAIFALSGDIPADNASSGGLGTPRQISADVGCIEQRSIVATTAGVFFQSERGIEIMTRSGGAVEWIGDKVQDEIAARPYVMAATLDSVQNLVRFELASSVSSGVVSGTGRGLVFDISMGAWSVDRRYDQAGTADAPAQSACMVWNGSAWRYAWLDAFGYVYTEDTSTYLDPGSRYVVRVAEAANTKPAVQGRVHVMNAKLLAKYATDSNVSLALAYDYSTSFNTARTWTRAEIAALAAGTGGAGTMPNVQLQHDGNDDAGDCMAVRVRITEAAPTGGTVGTGRGSIWNAVTVEYAPRDGGYQLPDGAR